MFSIVLVDILLIFVQLVLENFVKTVRDPPFITFSRVQSQKFKIMAFHAVLKVEG